MDLFLQAQEPAPSGNDVYRFNAEGRVFLDLIQPFLSNVLYLCWKPIRLKCFVLTLCVLYAALASGSQETKGEFVPAENELYARSVKTKPV